MNRTRTVKNNDLYIINYQNAVKDTLNNPSSDTVSQFQKLISVQLLNLIQIDGHAIKNDGEVYLIEYLLSPFILLVFQQNKTKNGQQNLLNKVGKKWTQLDCQHNCAYVTILPQNKVYEELSLRGFYSWEINEQNIYIIDNIAHIQVQDYTFNVKKTKDQLFKQFQLFALSDLEFTHNLSQQVKEELLKINDFRNMSAYLLGNGQDNKINKVHSYIKVLNNLFDFKINTVTLFEGNSCIYQCEPPKLMITRQIIPSKSKSLIIKTPDVDKFKDYDQDLLLKGIDREVHLLEQLQNNENAAHLYRYISIQDQKFILMKLYDGDLESIFAKISTLKQNLTTKQVYNITEQLLKGLSELHKLNIIHRDLKPKNIFVLNSNDLDNLKCIIADFDNSKKSTLQDKILQTCVQGTVNYVPPECQFIEQNNPSEYTNLMDVWTIGMIIYQIANQGIYPGYIKLNKQNFKEYVDDFNVQKISGTLQIYNYGRPFIELIVSCLKTNPNERISSSTAYQTYLQKVKKTTSITIKPYSQMSKLKSFTVITNKQIQKERQ